MVSDFKSHITVLVIIIALLARLRGFEILTNDFAHFFRFYDQVVAKKLAFTFLRRIERSTALSSIENFKWGLARTRLEAVVVGEFSMAESAVLLLTGQRLVNANFLAMT